MCGKNENELNVSDSAWRSTDTLYYCSVCRERSTDTLYRSSACRELSTDTLYSTQRYTAIPLCTMSHAHGFILADPGLVGNEMQRTDNWSDQVEV